MAMTGQRSVDERNGEKNGDKNGDRLAERAQAERGKAVELQKRR